LRSFSKKPGQSAPRSSSQDDVGMADARFENGLLAHGPSLFQRVLNHKPPLATAVGPVPLLPFR
jgi:hypothetical protein